MSHAGPVTQDDARLRGEPKPLALVTAAATAFATILELTLRRRDSAAFAACNPKAAGGVFNESLPFREYR